MANDHDLTVILHDLTVILTAGRITGLALQYHAETWERAAAHSGLDPVFREQIRTIAALRRQIDSLPETHHEPASNDPARPNRAEPDQSPQNVR